MAYEERVSQDAHLMALSSPLGAKLTRRPIDFRGFLRCFSCPLAGLKPKLILRGTHANPACIRVRTNSRV